MFNTGVRVAVIWIDWYPYHVARFRGLAEAAGLKGHVAGVEMVGGIGVHAGLKFREDLPIDLPVSTLLPESGWAAASKLRLARLVWQKLSELRPRVVLVPGYYTLPGLAAAAWARMHGAVSVLMTESTAHDHLRKGWKEQVKSLGLRMMFDWAVIGGQAHGEYLARLNFPASRIVDSYDVVDNEFFAAGAASARQQAPPAELPHTPYFLYVGRLAEEKNVLGLLRAWLVYRQAGGTWPLMLVGGGPEEASLREIASVSHHAHEVYLPGLKNSAELLPCYGFAGCFVLPSTREPWGLVVNEAMAAGLPVLVSNRCGCAPDLVLQGRNGYTFDPSDLDELSVRMRVIESLSASERAAMGLASARCVADFSPQAFGLSISSIYEHAAGRAKSTAIVSPRLPEEAQ
jgi:1,2-diacylglycerol 3-alpha-glucosyltransferase